MKTQSAKSKGRKLQQEVAKRIASFLDLPEEDVVSRPMGSPGDDIMLSRKALDLLPLAIECKNTKSFPSLAALDQRSSSKHTAAACWKPPRKGFEDTIIYFRLEDFLQLWKEKHGEK